MCPFSITARASATRKRSRLGTIDQRETLTNICLRLFDNDRTAGLSIHENASRVENEVQKFAFTTMVSAFSAPHFHDEDAAFAVVEARVWPNGPTCPHCGGVERISKMQGKSTRKGLYKCYQCRKPFTVRQGTIFESSHVPLHIWLQAMYLIAGSKKGISSNQLARTLGLTVKTAWFLAHRIREAMREGGLAPFGADGG